MGENTEEKQNKTCFDDDEEDEEQREGTRRGGFCLFPVLVSNWGVGGQKRVGASL